MAKYEYWLTDDGLLLLQAWARDGLTEEQIAKNAKVAPSTLREWKKHFPAISDALKRGKEPVDIEVENALHKKAMGFSETISKPIKVKEVLYKDGKRISEKERIEYVDEKVYFPPDTTALIYWLKNRMRGKWVDRPVAQDQGTEETGVVVLPPIKEVNGA